MLKRHPVLWLVMALVSGWSQGCECWPDRLSLPAGERFQDVDPTQATKSISDQTGVIHWTRGQPDAELSLTISRSKSPSEVSSNPCNDAFWFATPIEMQLTSADRILDAKHALLVSVTSEPEVRVPQSLSVELPLDAVALRQLLPGVLVDDDGADAGSSRSNRVALTLELVRSGRGPRFGTGRLALVGRDSLMLAALEFSP